MKLPLCQHTQTYQGILGPGAKQVSTTLPQHITCSTGQPHPQHGQGQPPIDISHGHKKIGKFSHCLSLFPMLISAKAISPEEQAAHKVKPETALGSVSERSLAGPGTASRLIGVHHTAGCPAPGKRCPTAQCRHRGCRSRRSTGLRKMPKSCAF